MGCEEVPEGSEAGLHGASLRGTSLAFPGTLLWGGGGSCQSVWPQSLCAAPVESLRNTRFAFFFFCFLFQKIKGKVVPP